MSTFCYVWSAARVNKVLNDRKEMKEKTAETEEATAEATTPKETSTPAATTEAETEPATVGATTPTETTATATTTTPEVRE